MFLFFGGLCVDFVISYNFHFCLVSFFVSTYRQNTTLSPPFITLLLSLVHESPPPFKFYSKVVLVIFHVSICILLVIAVHFCLRLVYCWYQVLLIAFNCYCTNHLFILNYPSYQFIPMSLFESLIFFVDIHNNLTLRIHLPFIYLL